MKKNTKFSSKLGFIAAAAGSAVGLINIWKFPYEVGLNGGAAFLLIYVVCILVLGFPLVYAKLSLGRLRGSGLNGAYGNFGFWKYLGPATALIPFMVLVFYYSKDPPGALAFVRQLNQERKKSILILLVPSVA